MFVDYGFELFVRVRLVSIECLVSIVFDLVVACFFESVFPRILAVPLSIPVCVCYLSE